MPDRFVISDGKLLKTSTTMYFPVAGKQWSTDSLYLPKSLNPSFDSLSPRSVYKDWKQVEFTANIIRITDEILASFT